MSKVRDWFDAVEEQGKELERRRQTIRNQIKEKGEPDAMFVYDFEGNITIRMWKIEGGVAAIYFKDERPNIDNITTYSDAFIDALIKSRKA